jgi:hypothetical protein
MLQFLKGLFRKKVEQAGPARQVRPTLEVLEGREVLNATLLGGFSWGAFSWGLRNGQISDVGATLIDGRAPTGAMSTRFVVSSNFRLGGNPVASFSPDGDRSALGSNPVAATPDYFFPVHNYRYIGGLGSNPVASYSPDGRPVG